jgi:hypothetical protein
MGSPARHRSSSTASRTRRPGYAPAARLLAAAAALAALIAAAPAQGDIHYLTHDLAVKTNKLYGHDCFWAPPKGMDYANLPNAKPIQTPNLYPDVGSTYFVAQYVLPEGASITLRGRFPHERYMSYTMFKPVGGNQIGPGDNLRDEEIVPDKGSVNPFVAPHSREAKRRRYTVHIVRGPVPAHPARNTLYTGQTDPTDRLGMSQRNYLPDKGIDGTGGVGLPKLTLNLADGRRLQGKAACAMLDPIEDKSTSTFPMGVWKSLVANSSDPVNAPAANPPVWERFWNAFYNVAGIFISDPATREATYPPTDSGGFQSNPDTRYLLTQISLRYGPVVTVSGKLPRVPETLPSARRWPGDAQVRYWSLCTGSSPVTGLGYNCVYDQQVPLRRHRRYTMVISKPADRPDNARLKCGYRWLSFGGGENYPDPAARGYIDTLYMRFMAADPDFAQAPQRVTEPGTEKQVMGPYLPRSSYLSKAEFEKRGCGS